MLQAYIEKFSQLGVFEVLAAKSDRSIASEDPKRGVLVHEMLYDNAGDDEPYQFWTGDVRQCCVQTLERLEKT
jgi:hypothetical protein